MIINYNMFIILQIWKVDSAYYIDLATKENKNFKLVDDNDYLVEILSESNDYYFVKNGV